MLKNEQEVERELERRMLHDPEFKAKVYRSAEVTASIFRARAGRQPRQIELNWARMTAAVTLVIEEDR